MIGIKPVKGVKEGLNVVSFFGLEDETCRRVLNTLKFVNEVFGASSQETVAVIEPGQSVRTDECLDDFLGEEVSLGTDPIEKEVCCPAGT